MAPLHPSYMWLLISSGYDQLTSTISILRFSYRGFRTFITVIKDLSHHRCLVGFQTRLWCNLNQEIADFK